MSCELAAVGDLPADERLDVVEDPDALDAFAETASPEQDQLPLTS
jgi:predicted RNA-binding Zn ribbon-like protein